MATLQKIRNRGGLIVVIIGIALLAFILGDILNSNSGLLSDSEHEIASVGDYSIPVQVYQSKVEEATTAIKLLRGTQELDQQITESINDQTWNSLIQSAILEDNYQDLGIGISNAEIKDMFVGDNIHPLVKQVFGNQETGEINAQAVQNFIENINGEFLEQKPILLYLEDEVKTKQKLIKYNNLVKKAVYVTKQQAEMITQEKNLDVSFNFVAKKYSDISDSTVTISESDISNYYDEHKNEYKQEASRNIAYVAWDVVASPEDNKHAQEWIHKIAPEFTSTDNTIQFVNFNSDASFDAKNYKQGELPARIDSLMFAADSGYVFGPYFEDRTYKLAKLHAINFMPDSMMASHILLKYEQTQEQYNAARAKLDSLKILVEGGADFAELAKVNLGWFQEGAMVKQFNDACFNGKTGDLIIIDSQFGSHLIKITGRGNDVKKLQVAFVTREVLPSSKTFQSFYAKASKFAGNNRTEQQFNTSITEQNLNKRVATITQNQKEVGGLENPRQLIRWSFEAEKGQVTSTVFEFGKRYVVALLVDVKEKGIAPLSQKRAEIEIAVKQDKKAELFVKKFNSAISNGKSINEIAQENGLKVEQAEAINFASFQIPNYGPEHKVIATAIASEKNKVSKAVKGNNGVFIVNVITTTEKTDMNTEIEKSRLMSSAQQRAEYDVYNSLKKNANVNDKRYKY